METRPFEVRVLIGSYAHIAILEVLRGVGVITDLALKIDLLAV